MGDSKRVMELGFSVGTYAGAAEDSATEGGEPCGGEGSREGEEHGLGLALFSSSNTCYGWGSG